ncbi:hypothetical protein ACQ4PT_059447 [Festuca glaucescens]
MIVKDDSNLDDGQSMEEGMGFRQGSEAQIGGVVDMEDDTWSSMRKTRSRRNPTIPIPGNCWQDSAHDWCQGEVKVFKLKYERVPYYCSHCGFMGHRKDECEKKRLGVPSLDYVVHELRCSPYKNYEHHAHYVPPAGQASARGGLSFASFGSAESHKSSRPYSNRKQNPWPKQRTQTEERVDLRSELPDNEVPPLVDDIVPGRIPGPGCVGAFDGFGETETLALNEVEVNLAAEVGAMQMEANLGA